MTDARKGGRYNMKEYVKALQLLREKGPLVQCITNFVTVNDCANIILAGGGSPSMAQDIREVEEAVCGAQALVCNMGAMDFVDSMIAAGRKANELGKPVVLDPVAAGGTQLRRDESVRLLGEVDFAVIRGNASEIRFLAGQGAAGSGVDVSAIDAVNEENLSEAVAMAKGLAEKTGGVIAVSGVIDIIADKDHAAVLRNGSATMARITGAGCMVTSLIGAFCGAYPENPFDACVAAMAVMGIAGEIAEKKRLEKGAGNATFRTDLIDAVFNMTEKQLEEGIRYEIF